MKLNRYILATVMAVAGGSTAMAQDSYDAERFASSDLNGTAKYVGMGGALSALGGDVSVMGSNPAGTALFRKNEGTFSLGAVMTDAKGALGHDATRMSIDNFGVVFATRYGSAGEPGLRFVNFGVNYVKKANFLGNLKTGIDHLGATFSQTWQIANLANQSYEADNWDGFLADMGAPYYDEEHPEHDFGGIIGEDEQGYYGIGAENAEYHRATYGSNSQMDVNLSFNVSDRYFFGLSIGAYSVDYSRESFYQEVGVDGNMYDFSNWYETTGEGFDLKFGFICRPIEDSPFRIGVSVHTPIWYELEDVNGSTMYYNDDFIVTKTALPFRYEYRTPWKFNLSMGHTIGNFMAIGAEYEYSDLSTAKYASIDIDNEQYFHDINYFTKKTLKGQHTVRLGAEIKPADNLAIRAGYNYISSPFKDGAYRTIAYNSPFTETDFTNWGDTERVTFGVGYKFGSAYLDLAYQYTFQEGDFYAFDDVDLKPTKIENNRGHLLATLGFRF